jgi:hypothetical protein
MSPLTIALIVAVLVFVIVRRARALIGRQKIRSSSLMLRLAIFAVLGGVVIAATITHPVNLLGDLVGLVIGAVVAWYGLRLTSFEHTPDGIYYTPNMYIGLAVFAVFLVRFGYRMLLIVLQANTLAAQSSVSGTNSFSQYYGRDPYTTAAYFILIGYYVVYYTALLLRHRQETGATATARWS